MMLCTARNVSKMRNVLWSHSSVLDHPHSLFFSMSSTAERMPTLPSSSIKSPFLCMSSMMSQPPINSPFMYTCGIVGQFEYALIPGTTNAHLLSSLYHDVNALLSPTHKYLYNKMLHTLMSSRHLQILKIRLYKNETDCAHICYNNIWQRHGHSYH